MPEETAKVHISLRDGILELQGSEEFVASQLKFLEPLIKDSFKASPAQSNAPSNTSGNDSSPSNSAPGGGAQGLSSYDTVFADADGKVQILKTLPGSNKATKTINGALLLAFANSLKGSETTPYSDVRDLCSAHACLDSGNFSKTMKAQKEHFIVTGTGSGQTIRLTIPGKKKAKELADGLK